MVFYSLPGVWNQQTPSKLGMGPRDQEQHDTKIHRHWEQPLAEKHHSSLLRDLPLLFA